jgi:NADH-quinone oxidoreductase subunit J
MIVATILFYVFAFILLFSAVMVIAAKNPVHSVLFLILAFFNAGALFVLLGAELLAMLLVIVYVGAVAVLFLFVVMMLNINFEKLRAGFMHFLPIGIAIAVIMFIELFVVLNASVIQIETATLLEARALPIVEGVTNTRAIGLVLYTDYIYVFQIAGLVLLVAMIGAIVLTLRKRKGVRRQNIGEQIARDRHSVRTVKVTSREGAQWNNS